MTTVSTIHEALHPETKAGASQGEGKRRSRGLVDNLSASTAQAFADEVAEKTGESRRTIERDIAVAEQLSRRKQIHEALHPETKHGGAPGKAGGGKVAKTDNVSTFADEVAAKTGESARNVRRYIEVAENLTDEAKDAIRNPTESRLP